MTNPSIPGRIQDLLDLHFLMMVQVFRAGQWRLLRIDLSGHHFLRMVQISSTTQGRLLRVTDLPDTNMSIWIQVPRRMSLTITDPPTTKLFFRIQTPITGKRVPEETQGLQMKVLEPDKKRGCGVLALVSNQPKIGKHKLGGISTNYA